MKRQTRDFSGPWALSPAPRSPSREVLNPWVPRRSEAHLLILHIKAQRPKGCVSCLRSWGIFERSETNSLFFLCEKIPMKTSLRAQQAVWTTRRGVRTAVGGGWAPGAVSPGRGCALSRLGTELTQGSMCRRWRELVRFIKWCESLGHTWASGKKT